MELDEPGFWLFLNQLVDIITEGFKFIRDITIFQNKIINFIGV